MKPAAHISKTLIAAALLVLAHLVSCSTAKPLHCGKYQVMLRYEFGYYTLVYADSLQMFSPSHAVLYLDGRQTTVFATSIRPHFIPCTKSFHYKLHPSMHP